MNNKVVLLSLLLFSTLISYLNMTSTFIILLLTIIIITQIHIQVPTNLYLEFNM
jgi:hypothetical protein